VHAQHDALRTRLGAIGLRLHGDLQIGISWRDRWQRDDLFLAGYSMGAPPSRTNPDGQPWGYPLLDPASAEAAAFFLARVSKMLREFDAMRVDHPHGHVCPWVYRTSDPDPLRAVNEGARLFESPDLPDHPLLARYAIARADQLDRTVKRFADGWVKTLDAAQVDAYARRCDAMIACAGENGRSPDDVACEVLSTSPYPLRRVMERHGLGRFRVTQKAKPDDPTDGYRTDHAEPNDWVMIGNHDTPPIWLAVKAWRGEPKLASWCDYLEARLGQGAVDRQAVDRDPAALIEPLFADLFASKARHVLVFFPDLLGGTEIYNRPGVVDPDNWMLRVDPDFEPLHRERVAQGTALGMARAFATALRARAAAGGPAHDELLARLDAIEPPRCKMPGAR
jgi:4-alpha-glucanotransferase